MLLARALKIVNITKVFTTLVAISSIRPVSGSIKVQIYKAIVIGMNPKGFLMHLEFHRQLLISFV